jgi:transposase
MMVLTKSKMANRYSPEVRARATRMVLEHQGSYETQAGPIAAIAPKIGCIPQTLSGWVKQAEKDSGMRDCVTTAQRDLIVGWRVCRSAKTDLFSMPLNRPCTIDGPSRKADWSITRIAAGNIYPFAIPSVWLKQVLNHRSAASGIPTTTPSLRR